MFCNRCLTDVAEAEHLNHAIDHLEKIIMTAFNEVQAAVDALAVTAETIATDIAAVQTDIGTALSGTVDLSALTTNIGNAQTAVTALAALVPAAAPVVEPAPTETPVA